MSRRFRIGLVLLILKGHTAIATDRRDMASEHSHSFAGNPIMPGKREGSLLTPAHIQDLLNSASTKILPFLDGKPLIKIVASGHGWHLAWQNLASLEAATGLKWDNAEDSSLLVYLGEEKGLVFWAVDISVFKDGNMTTVLERIGVESAQEYGLGFVDLRTLMMGTDWGDEKSMGELSIVGHARAMLEWHNQSKHCGRCGTATKSLEAGQRRQCTNEKWKHKCYPRTDPAVIMLVIDKEKDCALLGRQSRFVPRLWSCLAGFIEPGESLEEAVRRETREEAGIDVGEVVYHSSQHWPLGTSSMSCQLMIGFFAFAKSFSIHVDKKELEAIKFQHKLQLQHDFGANMFSLKAGYERSASRQVFDMISRKTNAVINPFAQKKINVEIYNPDLLPKYLCNSMATRCSSLDKFSRSRPGGRWFIHLSLQLLLKICKPAPKIEVFII